MTHKNNILWPCYFHLFLFTFTFYHCLAVTLLYCVTRMSAILWVVAALDFNSCSRCCMRSYMTAVICNACTVSIQPCSSLSMMSIACCCVCVGCCHCRPNKVIQTGCSCSAGHPVTLLDNSLPCVCFLT